MSVARTPGALVLDVEPCNQLVGCPGCGVIAQGVGACGGGGDRRALGRGHGADLVAQYCAGCAVNAPARRSHSWSTARRYMLPGCVRGRVRSVG